MHVTAHFDGRVFVPDGPIDLPVGQKVRIEIIPTDKGVGAPDAMRLLEAIRQLPVNDNWPSDGVKQLDHYLYGTPKVP